jgi:hypothetical protein
MSDWNLARLIWDQCVVDYNAGLRHPSEALERMLRVLRENVEFKTVERCAGVADQWGAQYPDSVFLPGGSSQDSQSAEMARHTCTIVAKRIRGLLQDDQDEP